MIVLGNSSTAAQAFLLSPPDWAKSSWGICCCDHELGYTNSRPRSFTQARHRQANNH